MTPRLFVAAALALAAVPEGRAQLVRAESISRNTATPLDGTGRSLWGTPQISVTRDGGQTWQQAALDSVRTGRARALSLDAEGPLVWAGLYRALDYGLDPFRHAGFAVTEDDGASWRLVAPPLDRAGDTVVAYGANRLRALVVVSPETYRGASLPQDVAIGPGGVVYTAGGFLGLRRTRDGGRSFERVVLPPDSLAAIEPSGTYAFRVGPRPGGTSTFRGHDNHDVLTVDVDARGRVWAGTMNGLNVSDDGGLAWRHVVPNGLPEGLPARAVTRVREQHPGDAARSAVWAAVERNRATRLNDTGRNGLVVTRDGGRSFRQALVFPADSEAITDLAFRGDSVYVGTNKGLLVSPDDGQTWQRVRDVCDRAVDAAACLSDQPVIALATTADGLVWAGTYDGLFRSADGGQTWRLARAAAPLAARGTEAETFAYPNPFSPVRQGVVRLRFDAAAADGPYTVRVFDFAMRRVRTLADAAAGPAREVLWDGTDEDGLRVANGVYFYTAEGVGRRVRGKVLVID